MLKFTITQRITIFGPRKSATDEVLFRLRARLPASLRQHDTLLRRTGGIRCCASRTARSRVLLLYLFVSSLSLSLSLSLWLSVSVSLLHGFYLSLSSHSLALSISIWQRIKNIDLVTGLGGHFATKVCSRCGCSATNPH